MGVCDPLPKTLTLFKNKNCDFITLPFASGTVVLNIIAFVNGLIDNDDHNGKLGYSIYNQKTIPLA